MPGRPSHRFWYCLVLVLGVLVAGARPALASGPATSVVQVPAGHPAEEHRAIADVRPFTGSAHGAWCRVHLSEAVLDTPRSLSWHRGTGRRQYRGLQGLLAPQNPAGSIAVLESFNGERLAWHVRVTRPPYVTGRCAAPPRAPPAQN